MNANFCPCPHLPHFLSMHVWDRPSPFPFSPSGYGVLLHSGCWALFTHATKGLLCLLELLLRTQAGLNRIGGGVSNPPPPAPH